MHSHGVGRTPTRHAAVTPVLHLVAGPNGAGKSTLATEVLVPVTDLPSVNAGVIAAERWPGQESAHAYGAARLATAERSRLLRALASFVTETVFSHESKVDLTRTAVAAGYVTYLHVVMIPEDLCVARVREHVARGGHGVPEHLIRERYRRLWPLIATALSVVDYGYVYDNTRAAAPLRRVARYVQGAQIGDVQWPAWAPPELRWR